MRNKKQGIIKTVILVLIGVIVLSMLGFDLQKIMTSDLVRRNLAYVWNFISTVWSDYLAVPFRFVWDLIKKLLGENLGDFFGKGE